MCLAVESHARHARGAGAKSWRRPASMTRPTARAAHGLHVIEGRALATRAFQRGPLPGAGRSLATDRRAGRPRAGGERVLDLCASPGGKTRRAQRRRRSRRAWSSPSDVRPHRVRLLTRTLTRCRVPNVDGRARAGGRAAAVRAGDVRPRADRRALLGPRHRPPRSRHPLAAIAGRPAAASPPRSASC